MKNNIILFITACVVSGCATVSYPPPRQTVHGVYHKVRMNETLWSIAKGYNVGIDRLTEYNKLPNQDKIEIGQMIFIPDRDQVVEIDLDEIYSENEKFIWPIKGGIISHFGSIKRASKNKGLDIKAKYGEDVLASRSGKVTYCSESMKGYGKTIIIDHGDGYQTVYAYNSENIASEGDFVKQNQVIAKAGNGGRAKSPSLHFEIRKKHEAVNPFYYLP